MPATNKIISPATLETIKIYLTTLQNKICLMLENEEPEQKFAADTWQHISGGGGVSRVMADGQVIEKAGVNFSHVFGDQLPTSATAKRVELRNQSFQALGVSVICHPVNPFVPTTHANVRFVLVEDALGVQNWWFGGGFDLTPYYGFTEDCIHWHKTAKQACQPFGDSLYPQYKKWCDDYFYLKHRQEPRGIGGIFFDDLNTNSFDHCFAFIKSVGEHFISAYQPILAARKNISFNQQQRDFQAYRRGRYVEFNLLYDRGTLFGLQSQGRVESILMSLPPQVSWKYNWQPQAGTPEVELYEKFLVPREWI